MTDEAGQYKHLDKHFAEHGFVRHTANEYVSFTDPTVHTNTIDGYFSIFKRGMKGVYQHCAKAHLHRYLAEFEITGSHLMLTTSSALTSCCVALLASG